MGLYRDSHVDKKTNTKMQILLKFGRLKPYNANSRTFIAFVYSSMTTVLTTVRIAKRTDPSMHALIGTVPIRRNSTRRGKPVQTLLPLSL